MVYFNDMNSEVIIKKWFCLIILSREQRIELFSNILNTFIKQRRFI